MNDNSVVIPVLSETLANDYFRKTLNTTHHSQVVVMALKPGEEIGMESHPNVEQLICIEQGEGTSVLNGVEKQISKGDIIIVTPGTLHNILNNRGAPNQSMKLFTIYTPPNHPPGTIHRTKKEADQDENDVPPPPSSMEGRLVKEQSPSQLGSEYSPCSHCKSKRVRLTCGKCKNLNYCSRDCVSQHWRTEHKEVCRG